MTKVNSKPGIIELLSDPKYRVLLHQTIQNETDKVYDLAQKLNVQTQEVQKIGEKFVADSENTVADLQNMLAYGCYFGSDEQAYLWTNALNRLASLRQSGGSNALLDLQIYPALLALYMAGISAVAAKSYTNLTAVIDTVVNRSGRDEARMLTRANCWALSSNAPAWIGIDPNRHTPLSDHLQEIISQRLPNEVCFGQNLEELFDKWEMIVAMIMADDQRGRDGGPWVPIGAFGWRSRHNDSGPLKSLDKEIDGASNSWFALKGGLFGGSHKRAKEALAVVNEISDRRGFF